MLIVFDFDSTLMDGESIDILAGAHGVADEVQQVTVRAMEGDIDFYQSLKMRVSLLRGMPLDLVLSTIANFRLHDGAKECVHSLRDSGHIVVCFSGGFRIVTDYFRDILGLSATFSNILHTFKNDDGVDVLSGEVGGEMMFSDSKGIMLRNLQGLLGIGSEDCVAVGDGANDLSMFEYAGIRIAFRAKDVLLRASTHAIYDLREVVEIIRV